MDQCLDEISDYEIIGRWLNYSSNATKNGTPKNRALYPFKREDSERPGYFTNKLSIVRLCRGCELASIPEWGVHAKIAVKCKPQGNTFKGFYIGLVREIRKIGLSVIPAPTKGNPVHAHIVFPYHNVKYQAGMLVSDLIKGRIKADIDDLGRIINKTVRFEDEQLVDAHIPTPCHVRCIYH